MSRKAGGFRPTEPPEPSRLTIDEVERFKKMFEDSPLARYIRWAGWGALLTVVLELLRVGWLVLRYVARF